MRAAEPKPGPCGRREGACARARGRREPRWGPAPGSRCAARRALHGRPRRPRSGSRAPCPPCALGSASSLAPSLRGCTLSLSPSPRLPGAGPRWCASPAPCSPALSAASQAGLGVRRLEVSPVRPTHSSASLLSGHPWAPGSTTFLWLTLGPLVS